MSIDADETTPTDGRSVLPPLTDEPNPHAPPHGLHLYHFASSLCSQKTRQVLEEKGVAWTSHEILLPVYAQYEPRYIRLNPRGVVPTLVREGKVTTDSENILLYVDRELGGGPSLIPADPGEARTMRAFLDQADGLFIEALTYADVPGHQRPLPFRLMSRGAHHKKVELLTARIREHAEDPTLRRAYEHKRALVRSVKAAVLSPERVQEIFESTREAIGRLCRQLSEGPAERGGWLCSETFSLADMAWGVVLYRLQALRLGGPLWGDRPSVARYAQRLFARPSFQRAVVDWDKPWSKVLVPLVRKKVGALLGA